MKVAFPIMQEVLSAIEQATGCRQEQISSRSRRQHIMFARFIFAHWMRSYGATLMQIGEVMNRVHGAVRYHIEHYETEYATNPLFRLMADQVSKHLDLVKKVDNRLRENKAKCRKIGLKVGIMKTPTITCPYTVGSAQRIWAEGLQAGLELARLYAENAKKIPAKVSGVNITNKQRDNSLDAMRE